MDFANELLRLTNQQTCKIHALATQIMADEPARIAAEVESSHRRLEYERAYEIVTHQKQLIDLTKQPRKPTDMIHEIYALERARVEAKEEHRLWLLARENAAQYEQQRLRRQALGLG
jgi:hypothetical protein